MNKLSLVVILLPISLNIYGQEFISLQDARRMALENNPDIRIAEKTINKAESEKKAAFSYYLPQVSANLTSAYFQKSIKEELFLPTFKPDIFTGELVPDLLYHPVTGYPIYDANGNPVFKSYAYFPLEISLKGAYMAGLQIQQPIFAGGKIVTANQMAKIGEQIARENLELQKQQIIIETDRAYWLLLAIIEKEKLAVTALAMFDSLQKKVANAVSVGLAHQSDWLKVKVEYNQALYDLQKAQSGKELARMSLCRIIGLPLNSNILPVDTIISIDEAFTKQFETEELLNRPELKILSEITQMEELKVKMERAKYLPTFGVSAGYSTLGNIDLGPITLNSTGFNAMATLSIPLFHWGEGKQKILSAKISHEIKQLEQGKAIQLINLELEQAKSELRNAYVKIQSTQTALEQAEENLKLIQNRYELGEEHLTSLLLAQTQWQKAYANHLEAKSEFKIKETAYKKASGTLVPSAFH